MEACHGRCAAEAYDLLRGTPYLTRNMTLKSWFYHYHYHYHPETSTAIEVAPFRHFCFRMIRLLNPSNRQNVILDLQNYPFFVYLTRLFIVLRFKYT